MAGKKFKNLESFQNKDTGTSILGDMLVDDGALHMENQEDTYAFEKIAVEQIILEEDIEIDETLRTDILDIMVNPVILSYDYTQEVKAGFPYRKKTGKYHIVDGKKRVAAYKAAYEENEKYQKISALVLPIDTEEEAIQKIKEKSNHSHTVSSYEMVDEVRLSENKEISYGYLYEQARIPVEKLVERDNKYAIADDEVEALSESIYRYGLFHDIMVLPKYDENGNILYEIQAGHKRTRAIRLLLAKAKAKQLVNGLQIIENYSKIPAKLLPLGATKEQIDAVYNESNIIGRHLNTDAIFAHLDYFKCVPSIPQTKEQYDNFRKTQSISAIASDVQQEFKKVGFRDWKSRKTAGYLNIYYFGSEALKKLCVEATQSKDGKPPISIKDLEWIATVYKGFDEKGMQDEIIEKALHDKSYIPALKAKTKIKKNKTLKLTSKDAAKRVILDKESWLKLVNADIEMLKDSAGDFEKILAHTKEIKKSITAFEKRIAELQKNEKES